MMLNFLNWLTNQVPDSEAQKHRAIFSLIVIIALWLMIGYFNHVAD